MDAIEDRKIAVSEEAARLIREKIEDGSFASPAEVVDAALQALAREAEEDAERLAWVKARIKASAEDTRPGYTSEEMRKHFLDLYEKASGRRHDSAA